MADEIDVARERVRQQLARDVAGVSQSPSLVQSRARRLGLTYDAGERVIDLVTGQEVTIEGSYREQIHIPNSGKSDR